MKVIVVGAGVIGTTTAYYLAKRGHEVEVLDRQPGAGLETSFANAGEISPGYCMPWAVPGLPKKVVKWMFRKHSPLVRSLDLNVNSCAWLSEFLSNCTASRYAENRSRMMRVAKYSQDKMKEIRLETGIEYSHGQGGLIHVFRDPAEFDALSKDMPRMKEHGIAVDRLDADQCCEMEPGLAGARTRIVGGLRIPNDETGDCFEFTKSLAEHSRNSGVVFRFGCHVENLITCNGVVESIQTNRGAIRGDCYVIAMGSFTSPMLRSIGIKIPVYPIKGYSLTIDVVQPDLAPRSTILDDHYKVAITRLGERIRVGGLAEIAGYSLTLRPDARRTLEYVFEGLFSGSGHSERGNFWTGLRPSTPDGTPIIGRTSISNLFLNTGHGTLGWTMACGSGQILADIVSNVRTEVRSDDLDMSRYQ